jgi:two-component system response regulator FixJ
VSAKARCLKAWQPGQPNKNIAFELGISPRTVEVYRTQLMGHGRKNLTELVRMVIDVDASGKTPQA